MSSKYCTKCGELKPLSKFRYRKEASDNCQSSCLSCNAKDALVRKQTRDGLVGCMMQNQRSNSKRRLHQPPTYTLAELREWVFSQPNFGQLYLDWVASGYSKKLIPSCDRTDNSKGYALDRLQLMTWQDNNELGSTAISNGTSRAQTQRAVRQLSIEDKPIREFSSIKEAAISTGACRTTIIGCCQGINQSSGGYHWQYA